MVSFNIPLNNTIIIHLEVERCGRFVIFVGFCRCCKGLEKAVTAFHFGERHRLDCPHDDPADSEEALLYVRFSVPSSARQWLDRDVD